MRLTYTTEHAWGALTQWHQAPDFTIELNDGDASPLSTLSWTLQDGAKASISFQSNESEFLGYYQKPNEGPIAYRGRRK